MIDRDAEIMLGLIEDVGLTVTRETFTGRTGKSTVRVTARDDNGHTQVVDADDELSALVELARRLGFEDLDRCTGSGER